MKNRKIIASILAVLLLLSVSIYSCKKDSNEGSGGSGYSKANMRITDGPASMYDAVYLNIKQIEVNSQGSWIVYTPKRQGFYDILKFNNGEDTLLGQFDIPSGRINQIRLILAEGSYVVVNGTKYSLNTPSAEESGIKLNIHESFMPGATYDIWIDFEVGRSIFKTGNGTYMMKPVIRAYTSSTNGKMAGQVLPENAQVIVYAVMGTDSFSAIPNSAGYYFIGGLETGKYQVVFEPQNTSFHSQIKSDIQVKAGSITIIESTTLVQ